MKAGKSNFSSCNPFCQCNLWKMKSKLKYAYQIWCKICKMVRSYVTIFDKMCDLRFLKFIGSAHSRYIKVKVELYLLFMFSLSKKLDRFRNKIHLFTFTSCSLSNLFFDIRKQNSVLPIYSILCTLGSLIKNSHVVILRRGRWCWNLQWSQTHRWRWELPSKA